MRAQRVYGANVRLEILLLLNESCMIRLDKYLSDLGLASRREAKEIIRSGRVQVDGKCVSSPDFRFDAENSSVSLDGAPLLYRKMRCFAMDKPTGVLTAARDKRQKTVMDLLPEELKRLELFPVGRLDKDTSGLLLLTNDGAFAHRVISPKTGVKKTYLARTDGVTDERDARAFAQGIELRDGLRCLPALLEPLGDDTCLVTVQEGKYHQVRRMLAAAGKPVLELRRLSVGGLKLEELTFQNGICELSQQQLERVLR